MSQTYWEPTLTVPVDPTRDHVAGHPAAPVTLLEYGDFECPYCAAAHGSVQEVRRLLGDTVRFAFRHFPLTTIHPNAEPAAEAAEAAGAQGGFWPMHDLLFANQPALGPRLFLASAEALGLDAERFAKELAEGVHAPKVREDFMSGVRSGVNGTPTFYVNGVRHNGTYDVDSLVEAVRGAV
jgi:protein-disulfide isomerase